MYVQEWQHALCFAVPHVSFKRKVFTKQHVKF